MMNKRDPLDSITGAPSVVPVLYRNPNTGQTERHDVEVSEVTMRGFKAFAMACSPFFKEFDEAGRLAERVNPETGDKIPPEEFALFSVLADHSEAFMNAAALVTNKPVTFFQGLAPDQFFEVAATIVQVNGDFFVRNLAPALLRVAKALGSIGTTTSNT